MKFNARYLAAVPMLESVDISNPARRMQIQAIKFMPDGRAVAASQSRVLVVLPNSEEAKLLEEENKGRESITLGLATCKQLRTHLNQAPKKWRYDDNMNYFMLSKTDGGARATATMRKKMEYLDDASTIELVDNGDYRLPKFESAVPTSKNWEPSSISVLGGGLLEDSVRILKEAVGGDKSATIKVESFKSNSGTAIYISVLEAWTHGNGRALMLQMGIGGQKPDEPFAWYDHFMNVSEEPVVEVSEAEEDDSEDDGLLNESEDEDEPEDES